jgi:hypothetical protein
MFFPAADTIAFSEGGVESMRLDSSGNVGIGTASPTTKLTTFNGSSKTLIRAASDLNFSGAYLGTATSSNRGAALELIGHVDANNGLSWRLSNSQDTSGALDLVFGCSSSSSTYAGLSYTEIMRLTTNGILQLTTGQIQFPAIQVPSSNANMLDDYEEGTWLPSLGGNTVYTARSGTYVKVGQLVTISFDIQVSTIGTGSVRLISGVPFTVSTGNSAGGGIGFFDGIATAVVSMFARVDGGSTQIVLDAITAASTSSGIPNIFQNNTRIIGSVTYRASA